MSNQYNKRYGQQLNFWINKLQKGNKNFSFKLGDFEIRFADYYSTAAKKGKNNLYCFDRYTKLDEPSIYFHYQDELKQTTHPINGLKNFGTLEGSFDNNNNTVRLNLAIIAPDF